MVYKLNIGQRWNTELGKGGRCNVHKADTCEVYGSMSHGREEVSVPLRGRERFSTIWFALALIADLLWEEQRVHTHA